ncbi:uncharacterized protein TRIVIDRAFT_151831 [Trichoderma virens Gv29-8]|uniref:Major facilitator superfamily (MFS) profile domain-containing protein n=1 Tax=Hypocrea virens (strain Gv29-8 / FGSC 10586) TaxID=413071 RepID=G9MUV9_HYPVG|nr:uncharacterized protein TRIVIDRAFT_151831 [Trichoderma virens Gv29-8]EHK21774.1 hypothetical protein TRIVIDRAFT_151831 [Trichoderma virens Gv29-8]
MDLSLQQSLRFGTLDNISKDEDKSTRQRLDLVLMPLLGFCYMLQFLDKMTLSYSSLLGLIKDTANKLVGSEYAWCASIFYFGYLFWSFPASYLMVRIPIGKYLAVSVFLWGAVLMCHAVTSNFAGLMVTRFLLGVTEASVAPGFSLLMGMFYSRKEQPFRHGLWFAGNSVANIIGGVLAYAIGTTESALAPWRLLFIIFGGITVFWSVLMLLMLPDSASKAKFLSPRQKEIAVARVADNNTGIRSNNFKWSQVFEALRDPQALLLFCWSLSVNLPNGGLTAFGSLVIAGFGYKGLNALLLQMPGGATQLVAVLLACYLPSRFQNIRIITMFSLNLISLIGMVIVYAVPAEHKNARLGGYCLCTVFAANMPLSLSLVSSNVGGFTKKTTANAMLFIAYCVGNILGPQFYKTKEAPSYPTGIRSSLTGFVLGAFFLAALRVYLPWINSRRERATAQASTQEMSVTDIIEEHMSDRTDWQRPDFRYVY